MTATPRTAAGRALLMRIIGPDEAVHDYTSAILTIEAEARERLDVERLAEALTALVAAVEARAGTLGLSLCPLTDAEHEAIAEARRAL